MNLSFEPTEEQRDELGEIEDRIKKTKLSKEANDKAMAELRKLRQMSPMSAEATVVRNYIDWLVKVPWKKRTKIKHDIASAQKIASTEPAAPSRCPMADLVDDRCAVDAALPSTRETARTSISSPAGVEVPCALT